MASPFVYEEPVAVPDLVGRQPELATLHDRALDGRNSRVDGPRRFGKTSLLRALLTACRDDGMVPVYVNFLGVLTADDVAARIERAYAEQLDGSLRRWFVGVARTWRPTLSAAPGGIGARLHAEPVEVPLLERLALPRRMHERNGMRCVITFDEFQEVVRAGAHLPGVLRSELEQHGDAAAYVFSGSRPGLMRKLFGDRRHAFYSQAAPVEIDRLPPDALAEFVGERFERRHRDPGEALGPLLDLAAGHPQRAMLLAHHLFEQTPARGVADTDVWARARAAALREVSSEVTAAWSALTTTQQRVLAVVADATTRLNSEQATERYGLMKSGTHRRIADDLAADGHLLPDASSPARHRVTDPLLELWVRNGRSWPATD